MDAAPAAIFVAHDAECRYISGNRTAYALLRQRPGGNLSKSAPEDERPVNFRAMQHGAEIPPAELPIQFAAATGQPVRNCELEVVFEDGTSIDLLGNNGRPQGAVAVLSDITERKRTERKMLQILAALESTSDAIGMSDAQGRHLYQNKAFTELFGYGSAEELQAVGGGPAAVCDPAIAREMFDTIQSGGSWRGELKMATKDGRVFEAFERADGIKDEAGAVIGLIGVITDITERKRAEESLRRSEMMYRAIGESIDYGVWVCAPDGRNTYASESFLRLVGLTQQQCSNFGWGDVLHPDDADRTIAAWKECVRTQGRWDIEHGFRGVDGEWHPVLARGVPVRDEQGRITCWAGINLDISGLKRAQESLRASEAQARAAAAELQAIMDAARAVILIAHDKEGRHVGGNRTARALLRQAPGSNLSKDAAYDDRPDNFRLLRDGVELLPSERPLPKVASTGQALRNYEVQVVFEDGASVDLLGNVEPLLDDSGRLRGAVAVLSDITERKQAEAALRDSEARLRHAQRLARVASWELDVATGKILWSDEMFRICGLPNDAQPDFEMFLSKVYPKDRDLIPETQRKARSSDAPLPVEYRIIRPDGEVRFVRSVVEAFKDSRGALVRFAGAAQDITDQVKAMTLLRESEASLKNAERMTHVGNWSWDVKSNQVSWSEEIFRIMGVPEGYTPTYEGSLQIIAPQDRSRGEQWLRNCVAERKGDSIELWIKRPNGDRRMIVCTSDVMLDEDGSPARVIGACQDVTDARREQEESLARQKLESLGTLASGIAHDFNNLLGGVLAQAELAAAQLAAGSYPNDELKQIRQVAIRGSEIVRQLMIYAGKESDVLGLLDVSQAVEEMLRLLKVAVSKHAALVANSASTSRRSGPVPRNLARF
jgi:PAS domain S-box-containing protein